MVFYISANIEGQKLYIKVDAEKPSNMKRYSVVNSKTTPEKLLTHLSDEKFISEHEYNLKTQK